MAQILHNNEIVARRHHVETIIILAILANSSTKPIKPVKSVLSEIANDAAAKGFIVAAQRARFNLCLHIKSSHFSLYRVHDVMLKEHRE